MSEVVDFLTEEEALLELQLDSYFLQESQYVIDVIKMGLRALREDDDVLEIHHEHPPRHHRQNDVQGSLKFGRSIAQSKCHA